jgi:hypothetical protein
MILGAPWGCAGNVTRRGRARQVFRAQPLKKRQDLRLRRRKGVHNLGARWQGDSPGN